MQVYTRFSPSPTGFLHIGGLRTALYAYLLARKSHGKFYIRIEDTDRERYVEGSVESLLRVLPIFHLQWDTLPKNMVGCQNGVLVQSQRVALYQKYAEELLKKNRAYYCFCTQERLRELRERQSKQSLPTGYDGLCRNHSQKEVQRRLEQGESHVIRLTMPKNGICEFTDLIRGTIQFRLDREEDAVIVKSDGYPTYHLAHVVDDHEMQITHVVRSEEWLSSIPKHWVLWNAFGWDMPSYAHLSLLVNPNRSKLSKRTGDVSVESFLQNGYLPEALLNFVLLMGWNPGTDKEIFSLTEMVSEFSLDKANVSSAVFNREKLDWFNGVYIRNTPLLHLVKLCVPYLQKAKLIGDTYNTEYLTRVISLEQPRLKKLSDLAMIVDYFFTDIQYAPALLSWKKQSRQSVLTHLQKLEEFFQNISEQSFTQQTLEKTIMNYIDTGHYQRGEVLWPLRAALTGREKSPGPFEVASVLGKNKSIERIRQAMQLFEA